MFGQIESESWIRQNACQQEVTLSRDGTVDLVYNLQTRSTVFDWLYCTVAHIYYNRIGLMFGHFESEFSIQQNAYRTGIYAIARRDKCICNRGWMFECNPESMDSSMKPDTSIGYPRG
jgi:hypothetical protein